MLPDFSPVLPLLPASPEQAIKGVKRKIWLFPFSSVKTAGFFECVKVELNDSILQSGSIGLRLSRHTNRRSIAHSGILRFNIW